MLRSLHVIVVWIFNPTRHPKHMEAGHIVFMVIYHEIISMVFLSILLIQEVQLSVSGKKIHTKYWLAT